MEGKKERQSVEKNASRVSQGIALESKDGERRKPDPEETLFHSIAEGMRDALVVINTDGKVRYWNPACEKMFGYTSSEAIDNSLEVIIPATYRKKYELALKNFRDKQERFPINGIFESETVRKDGTEVPIEVSVSMVSVGGKWHVVCVVRDISHWRRAQKELGETLARYQFMCNKHQDAIVLVDVETKRFLEANDAAISMYGFSKEEFLNLRTEEVFLEEDSRIVVHPKPAEAFMHRRKNGETFPVEMRGCLFNWKRRGTYCAIVRDVSGCPLVEEKEGS